VGQEACVDSVHIATSTPGGGFDTASVNTGGLVAVAWKKNPEFAPKIFAEKKSVGTPKFACAAAAANGSVQKTSLFCLVMEVQGDTYRANEALVLSDWVAPD